MLLVELNIFLIILLKKFEVDNMKKQAILIMYHNDYYILEKLLQQIDNEKFDIFLHVDKKTKNFNFEYTKNLLKKSNIYFTKRINVKWSTFSQIKCELLLLKEATKNNYAYYHLISGNDLLIKSSDKVYEFFNKSKDYEFVAYQDFNKDVSDNTLDRIKYYHFFNSYRRHNGNYLKKILSKVYYRLLWVQKKIKVNRLRNNQMVIKKGANWFSITNELAKYLLSKEKEIYRMYRYSNCADEIFIQTITYNSEFKNKIYHEYFDEHENIKRHIDWKRGEPYVFTINDYQELINSSAFFARKFSSVKDREIIDKIYEKTI